MISKPPNPSAPGTTAKVPFTVPTSLGIVAATKAPSDGRSSAIPITRSLDVLAVPSHTLTVKVSASVTPSTSVVGLVNWY
ncbi:hypothetical protein D3C77_698740 [compost metagenome]